MFRAALHEQAEAQTPSRTGEDRGHGSELVFPLSNTIRSYAWGSRTRLPRFLGLPGTDEPSAELWMGAHPGDPSRLPDGRTLIEAIEAAPAAVLGPAVVERFGQRLPYLMKVLAAAEPLSLQVHPSSERARIGFEAENRAGVPLDAPHRRYRDSSHKPELIFALTRFEGMAGFRDVVGSATLLRLLDLPWASAVADRLESAPPFQALRAVTTSMLETPRGTLPGLLQELRRAAVEAEQTLHRAENIVRPRSHRPDPVLREATRVFAQLPDLVDRYPCDPGILVTLLLNHVVLAPGESMYLGSGVIHAYTSGLGVEIMASSDNVLRAGLTSKHTDVDELLHVTDFTPMPAPLWAQADPGDADHTRIEPPVDEFSLTVARTPALELPREGPRIVLVLEGEVEVVTEAERIPATKGCSVFVAHDAGPLEVLGAGRIAVGAVPPG